MEYFGLPQRYMNGNGHFPNWEEERAAARAKKGKGKNKVKLSKAAEKRKRELQAKKGIVEVDENAKPQHFDIEVFRKVLKRFLLCNGEMRSQLRTKLLDDMNKTRKCFLDDHGETSYKKVVDVYELAELMTKNLFSLSPDIVQNLGSILICFGEIEYELKYGHRIPPETEEQRRAAIIKASVEQKIAEAKAAGEEIDEEE
jgi:hypothetical protein